jgi:hypothetical protein
MRAADLEGTDLNGRSLCQVALYQTLKPTIPALVPNKAFFIRQFTKKVSARTLSLALMFLRLVLLTGSASFISKTPVTSSVAPAI